MIGNETVDPANTQLEALMRQYYAAQDRLRGYVFSATRDYHATEDILQEVAIAVATQASSFDPERPAQPWFIGIARNQLLRWFREQGGRGLAVSIDVLEGCLPEYAAFSEPALSSRQVALKRCLGRLPGGQRRIIRLRYEDGLNCNQIASRVNRSIQSIYATLKRVKRALKECIEARIMQGEA